MDERTDLTLRSYLTAWWRTIGQIDGPTWRCVMALLQSPGELAASQCEPPIEGRPGRFPAHPIRIFLAVNVVFFFLAPWLSTAPDAPLKISIWRVSHRHLETLTPAITPWLEGRREASGLAEEAYRAVIDQTMTTLQGSAVFVLVPFLGLASFLVYRGRRRFLVEHLIFGSHLVSFALLTILAVGGVSRLAILLPRTWAKVALWVVIAAWLVWMTIVIFRSLKVFHRLEKWWTSAIFTAWMLVVLNYSILFYLYVLLFWSLLSLRGLTVS